MFSKGELLPEHVGVPMSEEFGGPSYLLFQTHYDNPLHEKNIRVDWGMDIFYTDQLRYVYLSLCLLQKCNWY